MEQQRTRSRWSASAFGAALILAIPASWADETPAGRIAFDKPGVDFGVVDQQTVLSHVFSVRNVGSGPLQIVTLMSGCTCLLVEMDSREIPPGGQSRVRLLFNSAIFEGPINKTLTVRSSDPIQPLLNYHIKADVRPIFAFSPPVIDFGSLEPGKTVEREVTLTETRRKPFAVKRITCAEPSLKVLLSPSGRASSKYRLKLALTPQQKSGPICLRVIVETDRVKYTDPSILLTGTVTGSVRVAPVAVFLGMARHGENFPPKILKVQNTGRQPIEILSVNPGDPALSATVTTNAPGREFSIDLKTLHALPPGWMRRTLRIVTSGSDIPLDVPVSGVVRAADGTTPP